MTGETGLALWRWSVLGAGALLCGLWEGTLLTQAQDTQQLAPGEHTLTLQRGGLKRRYVVHVPRAYDGLRPVPVVLMFHGAGGAAQGTLKETGWAGLADKAGFLVVLPEGVPPDPSRPPTFLRNPQLWNDGSRRGIIGKRYIDDVGFVNALLDDLAARFKIDARRVYATGFSNGAGFTFRLGTELSTRLAGIAPLASHCWLADPRPQRPLPTIYLIGTQDPLVPSEGGTAQTPWGKSDNKPPVRETLQKWAKALGCPPEPKVLKDKDGVKVTAYGPGKAGVEFLCYTIDGLGHHWPGGRAQLPERIAGKKSDKVKATEVIWEFFAKHAAPAKSGA